jgi:hypothetical protein
MHLCLTHFGGVDNWALVLLQAHFDRYNRVEMNGEWRIVGLYLSILMI